jgi:hypothetical protein
MKIIAIGELDIIGIVAVLFVLFVGFMVPLMPNDLLKRKRR